MKIMAKNILDEILKEDKSDIISNENEVLSELLNAVISPSHVNPPEDAPVIAKVFVEWVKTTAPLLKFITEPLAKNKSDHILAAEPNAAPSEVTGAKEFGVITKSFTSLTLKFILLIYYKRCFITFIVWFMIWLLLFYMHKLALTKLYQDFG